MLPAVMKSYGANCRAKRLVLQDDKFMSNDGLLKTSLMPSMKLSTDCVNMVALLTIRVRLKA